MNKSLVYYITGHGYGHAVRSIEIMRKVLDLAPDIRIHIRTAAPEWLFAEVISRGCRYHPVRLDAGALQEDSFSVNKDATLQAFAKLLQARTDLLQQEVSFLRDVDAAVVTSDITPIAFDAAEQAHVPTIAVGNFSWDWIYADWLPEFPEYGYIIDGIRESYRKADVLLRLPFYGDMSVFPVIEDVPLVGRKAALSTDTVRHRLGLPHANGDKVILIGLRYDDIKRVDLNAVAGTNGYTFIIKDSHTDLPGFRTFTEGELPFQDIVNACDAVLSKPGYSIVSECIVNRTPLLYVPRADFVEDTILRQGLQDWAVAEQMSLEQFRRGDWKPHLDRLFKNSRTWPDIPVNGAEIVARRILHRIIKVGVHLKD